MAMYDTERDPYDQQRSSGELGGDYTAYRAPEPEPVATSPTPSIASPSPYQTPGTTSLPPMYSNDPNGYSLTGEYRAPEASPKLPTLGQYSNQLEGYDANQLNDPGAANIKAQFGRLASRYPATQQGYAQLMQDPEFQRLGLQSVGNGNIRLPNGELIDVVRGFEAGGQAWQWGPISQQANTPSPAQDPWSQFTQAAQQAQAAQQQQYQLQQQQYQQQLQAWQQYQQQQQAWQQFQQQPPQPTPAPATPPPVAWGGPETPARYGPFIDWSNYQGPWSQLQGGLTPPGYGYNQGVGLQGGVTPATAPPAEQILNYLAQGMPSPYQYG